MLTHKLHSYRYTNIHIQHHDKSFFYIARILSFVCHCAFTRFHKTLAVLLFYLYLLHVPENMNSISFTSRCHQKWEIHLIVRQSNIRFWFNLIRILFFLNFFSYFLFNLSYYLYLNFILFSLLFHDFNLFLIFIYLFHF